MRSPPPSPPAMRPGDGWNRSCELDGRLDATKCVAEWRDASRQMGRQAAGMAVAAHGERADVANWPGW